MSGRKPLRPSTKSGNEKSKGKREDKQNSAEFDEIASDSRFRDALSAPIFKSKIHAKDNKIVLDDRFKSVLTDERFRVVPGGSVDQYGRKKKKKATENRALEELKDFYTVEQKEEGTDEDGFEEAKSSTKSKKEKSLKSAGKTDEEHLDYLTRLARGEISGSEDDSDEESDEEEEEEVDDDDSDEEEDEEEEDHDLLRNKKSPLDVDEIDEDAEYGEATYRISILNCDWENIRAQDLMVILQSFCPTGKMVKSVTVYPSDFGKERMAMEEKYGPQGIWKKAQENSSTATGKKRDIRNNKQQQDIINDFLGNDDNDDDDEEEDDDQDENADLYENIEAFDSEGDEEDGSETEDDENDDAAEEEESSDDESDRKKKKAKKSIGEFERKNGAVGLVIYDELKSRKSKKAASADSSVTGDDGSSSNSMGNGSYHSSTNQKKINKNQKKTTNSHDYDEIALRQYELSKLKYYFAIAECDSPETASILAEQLDDVEFSDSGMSLEIQFVPNELDLNSREIRDQCYEIPYNYKPPEFVINALQHTTVNCTWDEGEKIREKKLTNISSWRDLRESEFMQYIASSDSEDYSDDEGEGEGEAQIDEEDQDDDSASYGRGNGSVRGGGSATGSVKSQKKKKRAKSLRKLLLGDTADSGSDNDNNGNSGSEQDDFFQAANSSDESDYGEAANSDDDSMEIEAKSSKSKDTKNPKKKVSKSLDEAGSDDEMVLTYIPEVGKDILSKKKAREIQLTPYEISIQKEIEKKKAKKDTRKHLIETKIQETKLQKEQLRKTLPKIINEDDIEYDNEDRLVTGTIKPWEAERERRKEKVNKRKAKRLAKEEEKQASVASGTAGSSSTGSAAGGSSSTLLKSFEVDVTDPRFAKVFEGDANFGIDRTSNEFKESQGMNKILSEQRQRREKKSIKSQHQQQQQGQGLGQEAVGEGEGNDVNQLVNKLKRKFSQTRQ